MRQFVAAFQNALVVARPEEAQVQSKPDFTAEWNVTTW